MTPRPTTVATFAPPRPGGSLDGLDWPLLLTLWSAEDEEVTGTLEEVAALLAVVLFATAATLEEDPTEGDVTGTALSSSKAPKLEKSTLLSAPEEGWASHLLRV